MIKELQGISIGKIENIVIPGINRRIGEVDSKNDLQRVVFLLLDGLDKSEKMNRFLLDYYNMITCPVSDQ